jgi:hypothetical protein
MEPGAAWPLHSREGNLPKHQPQADFPQVEKIETVIMTVTGRSIELKKNNELKKNESRHCKIQRDRGELSWIDSNSSCTGVA